MTTTLDDSLGNEAAVWFAAQRRGVMSAEERTRFEDWRADRRNQAALDSLQKLWGELSGLKGAVTVPPTRRHNLLPLGLAASAILIVAAATLLFARLHPSPAQTVQTIVGEQRSSTLPDGTLVQLSPLTRLEYRTDTRAREVKLGYGEALFVVHHEAARPFVVHTANYEVRDLGTAFDVRERGNGVQVEVLEGVVEIKTLAAGSTPLLLRLTAGERVSLPAGGALAPDRGPQVERIPVESMAEWRHNMVSYQDTSIEDIVKDFNRFFPRPLEVLDPHLAGRRVSVHLEIEDRERALQTLAAVLGVRVQRSNDADVLTDTP